MADIHEEALVVLEAGDRLDALVAGDDRLLDLVGERLSSATSSAMRSGSIVPRSSARRSPSRYIAATWLTKVFVAATLISIPSG